MGSLLKRRRQLMEMIIAEGNRLFRADEDMQINIKDHINWPKKALSDINNNLEHLIQSSPSWYEKDNLLRSVPRIGKVVSTTFLIELPKLKD